MWIDDEGKIHRNRISSVRIKKILQIKSIWIVLIAAFSVVSFFGFRIITGDNVGNSNSTQAFNNEQHIAQAPHVPPSPPSLTYDTITHDSGEILAGSVVIIKDGAVYGGLGSARGRTVPSSQLAPTTHIVSEIRVHHDEKEARLQLINSWVAVRYLRLVD